MIEVFQQHFREILSISHWIIHTLFFSCPNFQVIDDPMNLKILTFTAGKRSTHNLSYKRHLRTALKDQFDILVNTFMKHLHVVLITPQISVSQIWSQISLALHHLTFYILLSITTNIHLTNEIQFNMLLSIIECRDTDRQKS